MQSEETQSDLGLNTPDREENFSDKKLNMRALLGPGGILDSKYITAASTYHGKRFSVDKPTTALRDPVHRLRLNTVQSR